MDRIPARNLGPWRRLAFDAYGLVADARGVDSGRIGGVDIDVSDPAIAEARNRADHVLAVARIADRAPRLQHGLAEQRIGDVEFAPDGGDQLVAADRAVAVLDEIDQHVEDFRRQRCERAAAAQLARGRIDRAGAEAVGRSRHRKEQRPPVGQA